MMLLISLSFCCDLKKGVHFVKYDPPSKVCKKDKKREK